jgi:hypothetical protein
MQTIYGEGFVKPARRDQVPGQQPIKKRQKVEPEDRRRLKIANGVRGMPFWLALG